MPTRETFEFLKRENEHLNRLVNALTDNNTHLLRRLEELERQLFKKK
jgi:predicted RNase H-like nuclease (RuvC/YqgF family)